MSESQTTIILANGGFPQNQHLLDLMEQAQRIVCCDGAVQSLLEHHLTPTVIIGDLDSISPSLVETYRDRLIHISEQETNDLCKAYRYCKSQHWDNITILGATGKREDHTLGNLAHFADFAKESPDIQLLTDEGRFLAKYGQCNLKTFPGQPISLFALEPNTPLYSKGLKYPLKGITPQKLWQATLNVATSDSVFISFPTGKPLLIFLANQQ